VDCEGACSGVIALRGLEFALQVGVAALAQLHDVVHQDDLALHKSFCEKLLHA
jgi:hypothetical protein